MFLCSLKYSYYLTTEIPTALVFFARKTYFLFFIFIFYCLKNV